MREGWALLVLLLWAKGLFCASKDHCQKDLIIGFKGNDSVLQPVVHGTPKEITWKKEENILMTLDGKDHSNGSLILTNISHSHAGNYIAEALVGDELQYTYYCLKVLDELKPVLSCFVHDDSIQVNCTVPPQVTSQNLPVSYLWEDRGSYIHHEPYIQLRRNTDLPEKITCIVSIANVNASGSITLSRCTSEAQQVEPRTHTVLIVLAVLIAVPAGIGILCKKGVFRKCKIPCFQKMQEDPGNAEDILLEQKQNRKELDRLLENSEEKGSESNAEDILLEQKQNCKELDRLLENSEEKGSENVSKNQEPSLRLPSSVTTADSDSAKKLEENEGIAEGTSPEQKQNRNESDRLLENSEEKGSESSADGSLLNKTQPLNHSRCIPEYFEEKRREDLPENHEQFLKEEGLSGPKPD